jgi:hypothetical protein
VGPPENPTRQIEKQEAHGCKGQGGRPRPRQCLLKGCERRFRPKHARQRYCSPQCREAARAWSGWKARRVYRATAAGKQKRNRQSQRYRKRVKERKPAEKEAVPEAARVIGRNFFRWLLRSARLLRVLPVRAALTAATVLFAGVPACDGARLGTRTTLAQAAWPAWPSGGQAASRAAAVKAQR